MKKRWVFAFLCTIAISFHAWAGEAEWESYLKAGDAADDYISAEKHYKAALVEAEISFTENHPNLATSLNILAVLYQELDRYAEAEPLYKRSLAIREKNHGPEHLDVAQSLNSLATLYHAQGRYPEAEPLYKRSLVIREKNHGPEHLDVAQSLNNLATLYLAQHRYMEAAPFSKRSLTIREKIHGMEHPVVAESLGNLAEILRVQGMYSEAESLSKRRLAINEKAHGAEHPHVAAVLNSLAAIYFIQGRYAEVEPLFKRSLAIWEKALGAGHPDVAVGLNNLAELYRAQGRFAEAEPLFKRCVAIWEKLYGSLHVQIATGLNNWAALHFDRGAFGEAEPLYKHSLTIYEKLLGYEHRSVARSLHNLAMVYQSQGRYTEAEPLIKRSLAIFEKELGPDHPDLAINLSGLAYHYLLLKRYAEAEPLFERSLAIYEKALGTEHPLYANILDHLAYLNLLQDRYTEAEPLFNRSLAILEKALGDEHPVVANNLKQLANLHRAQGRYAEAESLIKRSLNIEEKAFGVDHVYVATGLNGMAQIYFLQGRNTDALPLFRRATQVFTARFSLQDVPTKRGLLAEQRKTSGHFEKHVAALAAAGFVAGTPEAVVAESFEVAQWARASDTAEQVAKMAARHAAGTDALARVVRERQDLLAYLEKVEADRLAEVSKSVAERNAEREKQLKLVEDQARSKLLGLYLRIAREFPLYGEITQPKPLAVAEAQKLLAPDEALLLWLVGDKESYLWAVRRDRAAFHKLDMPRAELDAAVRSLRLYLDLGASSDPEQLFARPFDAVRAHALYAKLLGPAEGLLKGAKHLILVPDGPLQGLPPAVLVTEAPKAPVDHREAAWLVRKYALTVLPSANSLRALRAFAARKPGTDPLIGFGDPVLEGRGADGGTRNRGSRVPAGLVSRGAVADPKKVRQMDPLPNTADELKRIAASLKAPAGALHLGAQATETRVKQVDLTRARVLAFATHGLMAEEFQGMAEPALVLTPPAQASAQDDGLLTASEISQLRLNADWVVLSACNTAASDGRPGAEGLSGLSRAFFYAGARALMVSHWAVETNSAAALTTGAFAQKGLAKAEALRQSMLALMGRKDLPHADHPALWAPFVVVGEGGRR